MVHEPMKDKIEDIPEKNPGYEMIPRKSKLSIDLNRLVADEEHAIKNGNIVKEKIKPKVEEIEDNKQHVKTLNQHNDNRRQHIQEL